ncbi:MAG: hypothetical protein EHM21_14740 [Chloroflexi bacterium]|nr:MAG: hypothetical protein EHM21_14740 [Chloroflexota bacterium]
MQSIKTNRLRSFTGLAAIQSHLTLKNITAALLVVLVVAAIRLPIDYKRMMTITNNDYTVHIYYALDMLHQRPVPAFIWAHPLWELMLVGTWWLSRSRIDFWQSAIGIQALSSAATALMVFIWYGALPNRPGAWKRAFWAITLVIVTPVVLPTLIDGAYYFGYIGLANYHNPTVHVLRPFAILLFIFSIAALRNQKLSIWMILFSAAAVVGATLLKPNLTITLLPAVGLLTLYHIARRSPVNWKMLIFGLALPGFIVLGAQYYLAYAQGGSGGKIIFAPLAVAHTLSSYTGIKFFLSILFPLVITIVFFQKIRRDEEMILAWLAFAVGAAQYFLLAELPGLEHANFLWGAQICLFLLFAVTGRFVLKQDFSPAPLWNPKAWICYLAYLPHILAGIAYYIFAYVTPHYG